MWFLEAWAVKGVFEEEQMFSREKRRIYAVLALAIVAGVLLVAQGAGAQAPVGAAKARGAVNRPQDTATPTVTPTCGPAAWSVVTSPDPNPDYNEFNGIAA